MKTRRWLLLVLACLSLAALTARAGVEIVPTPGRNLYRLAVARLGDRNAASAIVGSTYDNRVCAFAPDGRRLWDAPVGGFVFDLAAGDLDDDGRDEIVAAGADGVVSVFDTEGRQRWTAASPARSLRLLPTARSWPEPGWRAWCACCALATSTATARMKQRP